ncbi:hypothetical protein [Vibrio salinus]|uniref:hypothetical protein n=1 Tax=Vibrio salinus TaxID=2899784 RepID=UPI001E49A738|nr:hypothetical protein [Vibrio salinus]MCE0494662.1 hypothetical protein [Vibrio salinus]
MMTTYCKSALLIENPLQIEELLTHFAREYLRAKRVIKLDYRQYTIDAGENDIRAVVIDEEKALIAFCCRYAKDVEIYESKIKQFATEHQLKIISRSNKNNE